MAMYKIKSLEKEYGPVDISTLRQWIEQGRVHRLTPVQIEGTSDWKPLSEFSEFQDLPLKSPPASPASGSGPGGVPPVRSSAGATNQSQGMAVASMILGIASTVLCLGILTGLPAIIMGHIAHRRARTQPETFGGSGFAIAGFTLGYVSLAISLLILPAMLLPALSKAKGKAQAIQCLNNMKQIGLGARMYSNDHENTFPPDFSTMANELNSPKILWCPADQEHVQALAWSDYDPDKNLSYQYLVPGLKEDSQAAGTVVFTCPIHHHQGLGDGSVLRGDINSGPAPSPFGD